MLNFSCPQFTGSFPSGCQINSVPESLKMLVACILGLDIKSEAKSQAQLTISQILFFNAPLNSTGEALKRYLCSREPPLPLYRGLKLHSMFRSEQLIKFLNHLGLSVSYNRVLDVVDALAERVAEFGRKENVAIELKMPSFYCLCF
eukprot:Pompholyxophrys_punicea_v1_NODE_1057_length_1004_cov_6.461538.p1 type:complete len:146 gc:universal NODE_1057_length_1004_cov_6.461538:268-705(+)